MHICLDVFELYLPCHLHKVWWLVKLVPMLAGKTLFLMCYFITYTESNVLDISGLSENSQYLKIHLFCISFVYGKQCRQQIKLIFGSDLHWFVLVW